MTDGFRKPEAVNTASYLISLHERRSFAGEALAYSCKEIKNFTCLQTKAMAPTCTVLHDGKPLTLQENGPFESCGGGQNNDTGINGILGVLPTQPHADGKSLASMGIARKFVGKCYGDDQYTIHTTPMGDGFGFQLGCAPKIDSNRCDTHPGWNQYGLNRDMQYMVTHKPNASLAQVIDTSMESTNRPPQYHTVNGQHKAVIQSGDHLQHHSLTMQVSSHDDKTLTSTMCHTPMPEMQFSVGKLSAPVKGVAHKTYNPHTQKSAYVIDQSDAHDFGGYIFDSTLSSTVSFGCNASADATTKACSTDSRPPLGGVDKDDSSADLYLPTATALTAWSSPIESPYLEDSGCV